MVWYHTMQVLTIVGNREKVHKVLKTPSWISVRYEFMSESLLSGTTRAIKATEEI